MKLTYHGRIVQGNIQFVHALRMQEELSTWDGKPVVVTVEKRKSKRSSQQNRYLWGVLYAAAREAFIDAGNYGISVEDIHDFFKSRYLRNGQEVVIPKTGEVLDMPPSTTKLSTGEMMEYIMEIQKFLAEYFSVVIPDPETQSELYV
jgi:hypothetical protein